VATDGYFDGDDKDGDWVLVLESGENNGKESFLKLSSPRIHTGLARVELRKVLFFGTISLCFFVCV